MSADRAGFRPVRSRAKKLEKILEFLTESHLDCYGGYPYDAAKIGTTWIIASLDDFKDRNQTKLEMYKEDALVQWYDRAVEFHRENPKEDFETCMYETEEHNQ